MPVAQRYPRGPKKKGTDPADALAELNDRASSGKLSAEDIAEWQREYADELGVERGHSGDALTMDDLRSGRYSAEELSHRTVEMARVLSGGNDGPAQLPTTMEEARALSQAQVLELGAEAVQARVAELTR